jgi:hypothetical protein
MKWKVPFSVLFLASIIMMFVYAKKPLVTYSKTTIENVYSADHIFSPEPVTRTYQDNYASIGAVIGFGILAGASLISFALVIRKDKYSEERKTQSSLVSTSTE